MTGAKPQSGSPFVPGTLVAGKYRLIKSLGEGAMGVVWSAVNEVTSGEVALKLIWKPEPEFRVRLLREAKACGTIRHKNVIQIHDVGQTEGGDPFLVMELLSGETLAELLARKRRLPPPEAASIGRDIARGLAAAHAKGIVHRDLKPANIFLHNEPGEDGVVVKVLDFGVAKNPLVSDGLRTAAGGTVGSPMYMSPEQASSQREIDARADIWSLGVVIFEMLTGERPFRGELAEVLLQIQMGEIPTVGRRVRRVDPALDAIVSGCLTRNREERLGPATEVARLLDQHANPGGREQLPSLLEDAISDRISSSSASSSSGGRLSPGMGSPGMQPVSAPVPSPSRSGGSAFGSGAYPAAPAPQTYAVTEPLVVSPVPRVAPRGPVLAGAAAVDDDAATHRIDPRMLAPFPQEGPGARPGPSGTVRIEPAAVDQALAERGMDRTPVPASLGTSPAPGAGGTLPLQPPPIKDTLPLIGPVAAPAPPPGTTSSTAPVLQGEARAAPASDSTGSKKKVLAVVGVVLAVLGIAGVVLFVVVPGKASTSVAPEEAPTTLPAPSVAPSAVSSAIGDAAPSAAPVASAEPSATAVPAEVPTTPPAPQPSATAPVVSTPPAKPTPTLKGKLPEPCGKFIKKPGCVPMKANPYD